MLQEEKRPLAEPLGRKEAIIASSVKTFSRYGFRASTIKRLARDAGISEALVYKYFSSKEELFDSVLNHLLEAGRSILPSPAAADPESDDRQFLVQLARGILFHFQQHPEQLRLLYFAALQGHSLASRYFDRQIRHYYEAIISRVAEGQKLGRYRALQPAAAARAFLGMVQHHVLVQVLFKDHFLSPGDPAWAETFVDIFIAGVKK